MPRLTVLAFCLCLLVGCSEEKTDQSTASTGDGQPNPSNTTPTNTGHSDPANTNTTPAPGHGQTTPGHNQHSQPMPMPGHEQTTPAPGHSQPMPMPMPMPMPGHEQTNTAPGHSQPMPMPMPMPGHEQTSTPPGHSQTPGVNPMPGTEGTNPADPNQQQNQIQQFDEGSVEKAIQSIVLELISGDPDNLERYISDDATGILADIRDGKLTAEQKADLKAQFAQVQLRSVRRNSNGSTTVYLINAQGDSLAFEARKVDGIFQARTLTIKQQRGPRN